MRLGDCPLPKPPLEGHQGQEQDSERQGVTGMPGAMKLTMRYGVLPT